MALLNRGEYNTVKDLIEHLQTLPQDAQICLSSDEEGNEYYKDIYPEETNGLVVLYPGGARLDLYDMQTYVEDEEDEDDD